MLTILGFLFTLLLTGKVFAQTYPYYPYPIFPPCFPWCPITWVQAPTTTPTPTPTLIPLPTPTSGITPTAIPTVTPTPTSIITPTAIPTITPTPTAGQSGVIKQGAYIGDGIENLSNVDSFEAMTGKTLNTILVYQAWEGDWKNFRPQWITNAKQNGSMAMITWEPWNYSFGVNQYNYRLANITAGNFDTHIRNYAKAAKATNTDFYLRPMHEMNGNWYPWAESANGNKKGDYVKAWKHIVDIFRSEGATNAKFVWCPNVNYSGSTPLAQVFPGDDYVDYVCMDGYNWGNTNGGWQSFNTLFAGTYNQITTLSSKPVIIGEMASAEQGGNKANWITDAYTSAKNLNRLVLINWFNANKEKDWRVNSSTNSLNAFKNAIK